MKTIFIASILVSVLSLMTSQLNYRDVYTSAMTCKMGRLQSPINLVDNLSSFNGTITPVYFNYMPILGAYLDWTADFRIVGLKQKSSATQMKNFGYMGLTRGGVLKQYALTGIEIYHPAEHYINGVQSQVEIKLIHEKVISFETTVNQYRRIPDANTNLIISFIYRIDGKVTDNGLLNLLLSTWSGSERTSLNYGVGSVDLDLNGFGVLEDKQFYFYEGSFTSTPCNEVVNQIVIKDIFYSSPEAISVLGNIYSKYVNKIASKNITEYFGRPIYRNFMNETEASSSFLQFNLLVCLAIFLLLL